MSAVVTLLPWSPGDLPLLERLMGDPRMTEHLGGPESPSRLRERQTRYERLTPGDQMFKIVEATTGASVGSVRSWRQPSKVWCTPAITRSTGSCWLPAPGAALGQDTQSSVDRSPGQAATTQLAIPRVKEGRRMLEYLQAVATRLLIEEDGQGTTEYGLVLVLVSILAMAVLQLIGVKVTGLLNVWP